MTKPYIERRHVTLEEEVELYGYGGHEMEGVSTWYARIEGWIVPTKENLRMSRSGRTANEALDNLREAAQRQGWELR